MQLGKAGKFAKTVFHFLWADDYGYCEVLVKGKAVNVGNDEGSSMYTEV